jgi:hypothetical protein
MWPLAAGALRLAIAGGGGWLITRAFGAGLDALFAVIALALITFGSTVAVAIRRGAWRR